jgi:hypothetical protein
MSAAALALAVAGCGGGGSQVPDVSRLPLVDGASVVARAQQCDRGADAYCTVELVVADSRYHSSLDLLKSERRHLHEVGWSLANGDTGNENAADSPGHQLRVTYSTADGDLQGIELGWIQRPRTITLALSRVLFARSAALSMMLERGSGGG